MTKTFFKAALAATVATGVFAAPAMAADTEPFTATATIVKPIELTKVTDLDFGTITMGSGLVSSNVVVDQAGTSPTCGANLTCTAPTAGSFTLLGIGLQGVDIDFTAPATLVNTADPLESIPFIADAPGSVTLLADGTGAFGFGGTITVAAATVDGVYSATFDVTASYN